MLVLNRSKVQIEMKVKHADGSDHIIHLQPSGRHHLRPGTTVTDAEKFRLRNFVKIYTDEQVQGASLLSQARAAAAAAADASNSSTGNATEAIVS